MGFFSLDELREPDVRTLKFGPLGLGGEMEARDALRFQQEVVSHPELVPDVPSTVSDSFERLRRIHAYGVLWYDFFTVADDQARLFLEFALRERFVEFHDGTVQFRDKAGELHDFPTTPFREIQAEAARHESKDDEWRLVIRRTGRGIRFDGMLDSLLRWAHEEGLLRGQRNRARNRLIESGRNHVAHGAGDHLLMPVDSARTIHDTAEIVNHLWGAPTPGGRLYPAPIRREVQLVGWTPGESIMSGQVAVPGDGQPIDLNDAVDQLGSALPGDSQIDDCTWVLVRADSAQDAFLHARSVAIGATGCSRKGKCQQCAVETIRRGNWKDVANALAAECPEARPHRVPDVRVSSGLRWPRYQQLTGEGNWLLGDR